MHQSSLTGHGSSNNDNIVRTLVLVWKSNLVDIVQIGFGLNSYKIVSLTKEMKSVVHSDYTPNPGG